MKFPGSSHNHVWLMPPKLAQLVKNCGSEFDFMDRAMRHAAISPEGYIHSITYRVSPLCVDNTYSTFHCNWTEIGETDSRWFGLLHLVQGPSTIATCPYQDHFNGSYNICCPVRENLSHISIKLQFLNFSMFTSHNRLMDKFIYNLTVANVGRIICVNEVSSYCCFDKENTSMVNDGYWLLVNGSWTWAVGSCIMPFMRRKPTARCLDKTYGGGIKLIGDSHVRFLM